MMRVMHDSLRGKGLNFRKQKEKYQLRSQGVGMIVIILDMNMA